MRDLFRLPLAPALLCLIALLGAPTAGWAENGREVAVEVKNLSEPERCAERDNIYLPFQQPQGGPVVRSFRIEILHPAYIGTLAADRQAPDWAQCDMSGDPTFLGKPRQAVLAETDRFRLVGYSYPSLWRPDSVKLHVGGKAEAGLHLVQLWLKQDGHAEEVLVVYPQDGYWRGRPLTPPNLKNTAYGSSFLVGPVEMDGRPIVALKDLSFDAKTGAFKLDFTRGGSATLALKSIDQERLLLNVSFDAAPPANQPFAALRSMYVTETNADAARVAWVEADGKGWGEAPVMSFSGGAAREFWLGRSLPSRHNTSAPDVTFGPFRATPEPAQPVHAADGRPQIAR
ncbi:hypothetical protein ACFQU1_01440 [Chelatococcus sp. GCM10030263]|uniref:hypothetical protein n=1 Tax=Chelatococcus sp. GCM10030263 TaxID=3273387 RepID=UPI00360E5098